MNGIIDDDDFISYDPLDNPVGHYVYTVPRRAERLKKQPMNMNLLILALIFLGAFMGVSLVTANFTSFITTNVSASVIVLGLSTGVILAGTFLIAGMFLLVKALRSR